MPKPGAFTVATSIYLKLIISTVASLIVFCPGKAAVAQFSNGISSCFFRTPARFFFAVDADATLPRENENQDIGQDQNYDRNARPPVAKPHEKDLADRIFIRAHYEIILSSHQVAILVGDVSRQQLIGIGCRCHHANSIVVKIVRVQKRIINDQNILGVDKSPVDFALDCSQTI